MAKRRRRKLPLTLVILLALAAIAYSYLQRKGYVPDIPSPPGANDGRGRAGGGASSPEVNVALGLPGPAVADGSVRERYLIERSEYVLSYNAELGIANWVSWHVDSSDLGFAERSQFAPDPALPDGWDRVTPTDYRNSGYDRGHLCPSADRTATAEANTATFYMTNIVPQSPDNNQGPWADFEIYCRDLVRDGKEMYAIAGGAGISKRIGNGKVAAPKSIWKVVVVLENGADDLARIDDRTRVIAIEIPNRKGIRNKDWRDFRTSVDRIEAATGLDLLSRVPIDVQSAIESRVDSK